MARPYRRAESSSAVPRAPCRLRMPGRRNEIPAGCCEMSRITTGRRRVSGYCLRPARSVTAGGRLLAQVVGPGVGQLERLPETFHEDARLLREPSVSG